jgi:hypothetical protein
VPAGLRLYPNPAHGLVTVMGLPAGQPVEVFDSWGRLVASDAVPPTGLLPLALPAGLAQGLYLVRAGGKSQRLLVD